MTDFDIASVIQDLRKDENYYGELGRGYISSSDIKALHESPLSFKKIQEKEPSYFAKGKYIHTRILQPERLGEIKVVDATTRSTKVYKEEVAANSIEGFPPPTFLLSGEAAEMELWATKIESSETFVNDLQRGAGPHDIEEPIIGELFGYWFKAKADRINREQGFVADLKTTRSLSSFVSGFYSLGYHAQAYIYSKLFGLPMRFYVFSKEDGRLGVYDVSQESLERAEGYIKWALERMEMYYGDNPPLSIEQYHEYKTI